MTKACPFGANCPDTDSKTSNVNSRAGGTLWRPGLVMAPVRAVWMRPARTASVSTLTVVSAVALLTSQASVF